MNTADFQRVRELFLAARKLSGPARDVYLAEACADDGALRSEVDSLLSNHDEPGAAARLIDSPVLGTLGSRALRSAAGDPIPTEVPDRIGQYRVIRPIGEGAMGCVYEAEQDNPRRRVALKVLRSGLLSQQVLQRFEREAQILGRLHHAGIAQVYEAGTFGPPDRPSRAQPFFAMEFIQGEPLAKYAAESHLSVRERLKLVAKICDAVQHAHDRGVIHRDLKPANIMVVREGDQAGGLSATGGSGGAAGGGAGSGGVQPKVLDFGVARAADSDLKLTTIQTGMGQLIGTVAYMSPEQAAGDPTQIDARSDVYALGVICYELLAGRLPYDVGNRLLHEAVRVIREQDAAPLSSIDRTLRGDVETIVAKALEKERERRYPSAGAMAADIRRFLADEPIVARPATTVYQLRKFAQRNKVLVGGLAATAAALLTGTVVSTAMYFKADAARKREASLATIARDKAAEATEANAAAQREARKARAVNTFIVERMLRSPDPARDGRDIKVVEVLDKAAAEAGAAFPGDPETEAQVRVALARTYQSLGQFEPMLPQAKLVYDLRAKALGPTHKDTIEGAVLLGQAHINLDQSDDAERVLRAALADLGDLASDSDDATLDLKGTLGSALQQAQRFDEAEPLLRSVIAAREAISKEPTSDLMYNINILGACLDAQNKTEEALQVHQRFLDTSRALTGHDNPASLAGAINVANLLMQTKRVLEAEALIKETVAGCDRVLGPEHAQTGMARLTYGRCLTRLAKNAAADEQLGLAVKILRASLGDRSYATENAMQIHYEFLLMSGELRRGEALVRERLAARAARGAEHEEVQLEVWNTHITAMNRLAMCTQSEGEARRAVDLARTLYPAGDARIARVESWLGETLICLKRYAEAEPLLLMCYATQKNAGGLGGRDAWVTAGMLAQLYDRTGRGEEAQRWMKLSNE